MTDAYIAVLFKGGFVEDTRFSACRNHTILPNGNLRITPYLTNTPRNPLVQEFELFGSWVDHVTSPTYIHSQFGEEYRYHLHRYEILSFLQIEEYAKNIEHLYYFNEYHEEIEPMTLEKMNAWRPEES